MTSLLNFKHFSATFIALALIFQSEAHAQSLENGPSKVIVELGRQIQRISLQTGHYLEFKVAEEKAKQELKRLIDQDPSAEMLIQKDSAGLTPLMLASAYGFSGLVEELLRSGRVKATIDTDGPNQTTAWMFANFAFRETLWSCRPQILGDPFAWVPIFEAQGYYQTTVGKNPYESARLVLENAGATADLVGAKAAWLERCPNSDGDLKSKVRQSTDLLQTLRDDGKGRFLLHQAKLQKNSLNAAPVQPITSSRTPSLQDIELPPDFAIKEPSPTLGTLPSKLTGWWTANSFMLGEFLFAFEQFNSENEATVVMVIKSSQSKPYKGRRVKLTIEGNTLSTNPSNEAQITFTLASDGQVTALLALPKVQVPLNLKRPQP